MLFPTTKTPTSTRRTQCSRLTRKGFPCSIHADRQRDGLMYCHVHDPEGVYQRQRRGETAGACSPKPIDEGLGMITTNRIVREGIDDSAPF